MNNMSRITLVPLLFFVAGCGGDRLQYEVTKTSTTKPTVITTDAKQRSLISMPYKPKDPDFIVARVCAEPSPDVFTAIASSFGLDTRAKADVDANDFEAGLNLAKSLSENAATIERTQTINILRESMYRTCERYMSGAIQWNELVVQAARDQRTMVSILAIEQLTGVIKAQSTALTTNATAQISGAEKAGERLAEARERLDKAKQEAEAKPKAADEMVPTDKDCGVLLAKPEEGQEAPSLSEDEEKKKEACVEAGTAEGRSAEAQKYYDALLALSDTISGNIQSNASGQVTAAAAQLASANEKIAKTVFQIVQENNDFDEFGMTCVAVLRASEMAFEELIQSKDDSDKERMRNERASLVDTCTELAQAAIEANLAEEKLRKDRADKARQDERAQ